MSNRRDLTFLLLPARGKLRLLMISSCRSRKYCCELKLVKRFVIYASTDQGDHSIITTSCCYQAALSYRISANSSVSNWLKLMQ